MAGRRGVRGFLAGAAAAGMLFTMGMPGIVSADGGQTNLIHACILPIEDGGNVRIVGANDTCPESTTPLHWPAGAELEVESTEVPPPTQGSVQPPTRVFKKLYKPLGIRVTKTTTVTKTLGPFSSVAKALTVDCPSSHPFVLAGTSSVVEPQFSPGEVLSSHAVGWHGWYAAHSAYTWKLSPLTLTQYKAEVHWTLRVEVKCAKTGKIPPN